MLNSYICVIILYTDESMYPSSSLEEMEVLKVVELFGQFSEV